ncbi:hypothetical protein CBER1_05882 [Cercospora berteroae]|uniref:IBR domain-containing protein n=1 Tax=Cercospora berteroae TaxID=357750 RepID=A0A2S6C7F6_9PEZI|nr:hypothetical protein CBER1_05882 [Cercospora berteroae]
MRDQRYDFYRLVALTWTYARVAEFANRSLASVLKYGRWDKSKLGQEVCSLLCNILAFLEWWLRDLDASGGHVHKMLENFHLERLVEELNHAVLKRHVRLQQVAEAWKHEEKKGLQVWARVHRKPNLRIMVSNTFDDRSMHPEEEPNLEKAMYGLDLGHRLARNPFIPAPDCVVCGEELRGDRRPIKINEYYCCPVCFDLPGSFRSQFEAFVRPGIQQRPKFGDKDIEFTGCCWQFSPAFHDAFKHKLDELRYLPENRLYCARDGCAKFLGPRDGPLAHYREWRDAKTPRPVHECAKKETVEKALEGLKRGRDYQFCPGCHWLIELSDACNHLTCQYNCGTQFCYLCGQRAKKKSGHWAQGAPCPLYGPPDGPNPLYEPEDDEESEDDDEDEDDNEDDDPVPDGDVPDNNLNEDQGGDEEAPDHQPDRARDADGNHPNHDADGPPPNHDAGDHGPPHDIEGEAPFQDGEAHPPEHELDDGFEQANGQNFDADDPDEQADENDGDRAPEQRLIEDDGQEGGHDVNIDDLWEPAEEEGHREEAGMFAPPRVLPIAYRIQVLILSVSTYRMNHGMPWYLVSDTSGPNQDPPQGAQANIFSWLRRKDRRQLRDMYVDLQEWGLQRMPGPFHPGMHALGYLIKTLLLGLDYYTVHEIDRLEDRATFRQYLAHWHPLADYVFGLMPNQANLRYPTLSRIIATYCMAKTGNVENLRGWLWQRMWTPDREDDPHIDRRHSLDSIALSLAM